MLETPEHHHYHVVHTVKQTPSADKETVRKSTVSVTMGDGTKNNWIWPPEVRVYTGDTAHYIPTNTIPSGTTQCSRWSWERQQEESPTSAEGKNVR